MKLVDIVIPDEGDYAHVLPRLVLQAEKAFGDKESALDWLYSKQISLGDKAPVEMLRSNEGVQAVEDLLGRIIHGVYS
jgi:putative toxin-antitoxin system antitoxin component (TIGR02293 family)